MSWLARAALLTGLVACSVPAWAQARSAAQEPVLASDAGRAAEAASASTAAGTMLDGQHAFDSGEYAKAEAIWTVLARRGDDDAAVALAGMLDEGTGPRHDPAEALRWYRVAAEHGLPAAEFDLAVMLDSGRGAARDLVKAATWYARAAARGNRRAQYNLGQMYAAGEGVPLNPAASRAWYDAAARNGVVAAAAKLAANTSPSEPRQLAVSPDLRPVVMQLPFANEELTMPPATAGVEFVWLAPPQPAPVVFFVEVAAIGGQGTRRVVRYVAETAVVLDLGKAPGNYAWRVYAVDQRRQRYVAGEWQRFSITAAETSHD